MNNWLGRAIILLLAGGGCVLSLQYATGHFKGERQIILLNRTRPDFHHFLDLEKHPSSSPSRNDLKEYYDYFQLVTEAMPDNSDGMLMLGYLDMVTGRNPQAKVSLTEAYRLDPQFFFIIYDLALISYRQGDYGQSTDLLQKALSIAPQLTLKSMLESTIYRQVLSSMKDSGDLVIGLQQAYNDAAVLLNESMLKQKGAQVENAAPQVFAHIM